MAVPVYGPLAPEQHNPIPAQKERVISTKIFVGNLSFDTTEQDLSKVLSEAGRVVRVHIGTDRETGRSRGFAFVEFEAESVAADAIRRFDGFELGGRRLRVNNAEDRPAGRPTSRPRLGPSASPPPSSALRDLYAAGDPFASEAGAGGPSRGFKTKGSRRGLRARKRSLSY